MNESFPDYSKLRVKDRKYLEIFQQNKGIIFDRSHETFSVL